MHSASVFVAVTPWSALYVHAPPELSPLIVARRALVGRIAGLGIGAAVQLACGQQARAAQMPMIAPAPQEGDCAGEPHACLPGMKIEMRVDAGMLPARLSLLGA